MNYLIDYAKNNFLGVPFWRVLYSNQDKAMISPTIPNAEPTHIKVGHTKRDFKKKNLKDISL